MSCDKLWNVDLYRWQPASGNMPDFWVLDPTRRGPFRCSNSMATADGTPPEFHWWTAQSRRIRSIRGVRRRRLYHLQ